MKLPTNTLFNDTSATMKLSRSDALSATHARPELRFEEQELTSFSGLVLFQSLFARLGLYRRLARCFRHCSNQPVYPQARIILLLIVHLLLGFRCLRESRYYAVDPMVLRVIGLKRLPAVSTISRQVSALDERSVENLEATRRELVLERVAKLDSPRITLDFDGTVLGTDRKCEGVAVGYNKKKKGQRSYYPLYCTVAQCDQVLAVLNRSGNVHDSHGAKDFVLECIEAVRAVRTTRTLMEVRMDSAFFNEEIINALEQAGVRYSISVPLGQYLSLKEHIESQIHWQAIDPWRDVFEANWRPSRWKKNRRVLFVRQFCARKRKGPLQLDLFEPQDHDFDFKVIVTNRKGAIANGVLVHEGRGSQEGIFAELKSENALAYIPTNTWLGNRAFMTAVLIAHNLTRELTMLSEEKSRFSCDPRRAALWRFPRTGTLRHKLLRQAGRLIRPQGKLTLSMKINDAVKSCLESALHSIEAAA